MIKYKKEKEINSMKVSCNDMNLKVAEISKKKHLNDKNVTLFDGSTEYTQLGFKAGSFFTLW